MTTQATTIADEDMTTSCLVIGAAMWPNISKYPTPLFEGATLEPASLEPA